MPLSMKAVSLTDLWTMSDRAERDLCNNKRVGKADPSGMRSLPRSPETVIKGSDP